MNRDRLPIAGRRIWRIALGGVGLVAAGMVVWLYLAAPRPPEVPTEGIDFAITQAIKKATTRVRFLPWSGVAWGRLGSVFYVHHFNAAADEAFAVAERCRPRDPRWPYLRGLSRAEEDLAAALPMLRRAAELSGNGPPAVRLRFAELLLERGELAEAETQIDQVLRHHPTDGRALLNGGRLALLRGELEESRDYLERARQRAPRVKAVLTLLAMVQTRLGDQEAATKTLTAAAALGDIAFWPDAFRQETLEFKVGKDALLEQSNAATQRGDYEGALRILEGVTRDYPDSTRAWIARAYAHRQRGELSLARTALDAAFKLDAESVEARMELGSILYDEKNFEEAERHFREAIRIRPATAEAWFNLGLTLTATRSLAEAIEAFERAKAIKPQLADAYIFLGQALAMSGRLSEAGQELEHALELSPEDSRARRLLEQVRRAMRDDGKLPLAE